LPKKVRKVSAPSGGQQPDNAGKRAAAEELGIDEKGARMTPDQSIDDPIVEARRVGFVLSQAELALGIDHKLPLDLKLNHILQGAMEQPAKVSVESYTLAYRLAGARA
jgi:hypothetical protein